MKSTTLIRMAAAFAAAMASTSANAQTPAWSVSFDLSTQIALSGDVHGGGTGTVLGLPTQVTAKSYDDVYGAGFSWTAGLGYRINERGEVRVSGGYTDNPAERLQVGTVAGLPLFGLFDDYKAFAMDVGYRRHFGAGRAKPFVGGSVGFVRLDTVASEFSVPAAGVVLSDVDFLESTVAPAFSVGGGLQVDLSDRFAVQGGLDLRWHGDAQDLDGLAGTGLESINDETRRWSMPVTGGVTVRF
jgi:hypothetical protein